jgi:hypothetical protein
MTSARYNRIIENFRCCLKSILHNPGFRIWGSRYIALRTYRADYVSNVAPHSFKFRHISGSGSWNLLALQGMPRYFELGHASFLVHSHKSDLILSVLHFYAFVPQPPSMCIFYSGETSNKYASSNRFKTTIRTTHTKTQGTINTGLHKNVPEKRRGERKIRKT